MSSSSSISSSDTVIDLSLPNPVVKNIHRFSTDPTWVTCSRSPLTSRQSECHKDKLPPSPLLPPLEDSVDSPSRQLQRRHTWSRLYLEELKQSSVSRLPSAATSDSMSKSLGDLTSEDIACHFDSTYHSISRSLVSRPSREQNPEDRQKPQPADKLTEQLRRLASVEPLTARDFREVEEETTGVRRTSRSHSRVRYIANRAKKAQERQRIQGLIQGRSASFSFTTCAGSGGRSNPIEERGNPEGACSSAQSSCTSEELLEQLKLLASQSPRRSRLPAEPHNTEVFFLLRLWEDATAQFYPREISIIPFRNPQVPLTSINSCAFLGRLSKGAESSVCTNLWALNVLKSGWLWTFCLCFTWANSSNRKHFLLKKMFSKKVCSNSYCNLGLTSETLGPFVSPHPSHTQRVRLGLKLNQRRLCW